MGATSGLALGLLALYGLFWWWYGGRQKPLTATETEQLMAQLRATVIGHDPEQEHLLQSVAQAVAKDDGREFVMVNLVRHRAKALYPPALQEQMGDDPRLADRRYGKALMPHLLKGAGHPVLIARRAGSFIEPEGADPWHYVALVRYRSRRDFLKFAIRMEQAGNVTVHKWAAIEKTHVFPVQPMVSLITVRLLVAGGLALVGWVGVMVLG